MRSAQLARGRLSADVLEAEQRDEAWFPASCAASMVIKIFVCLHVGGTRAASSNLRALQASHCLLGSATMCRERLIPSKSKYLCVRRDRPEIFPVTPGSFLSRTSCCRNIPQVRGQSLLPGRPEHPAEVWDCLGLDNSEMLLMLKVFRITSVNAAAELPRIA